MAQIKKDTSLRKAILQAAITGQLGISNVQCAISETGKELLQRIIAERNAKALAEHNRKGELSHRLDFANAKSEKNKQKPETALAVSNPCDNKKTRTKKPAPIVASEIYADEIPFEIPENWCWCRLGDLVAILGDGLHGTPQYDISGEYYFINGNNLNNGVIEIKPDTKKVNEKEFEKYKKDLNETTIFVSINGTIGNIAFYNNEKIILGKSACYFNVVIEDLKKYFFYLFQTDFFLKYALANATGTTIKNVGLGTMRNFPIPLPPLAVQKAIVAKLEEVLPLVEIYENAVLQKEELKNTLSDKVKKAILQEAVTGQLEIGNVQLEISNVQCAIIETGKELLERIIAERNAQALAEWEGKNCHSELVSESTENCHTDSELLRNSQNKEQSRVSVGNSNPCGNKKTRAKKPAPIVASEIDADEIPFEIPENWCWCRLGDVGDFVRGSGIKRNETVEHGFPCIRYGELYTTYKTKFSVIKSFVPKDLFDKCHHISKNDICMALTGENKFDIALAAVYEGNETVAIGGDLTKFTSYLCNPLYLVYVINSPYGIECKRNLATGDIICHISNDKLASILIPLPPLAVQKAIVAKLEELLPLCKHIEN